MPALLLLVAFSLIPAALGGGLTGFLTRNGSTLLNNNQPYRFGGLNLYYLGLDENEGGVHYPTKFRVTDGLETVAGFLPNTLVRSHTIAISTGNPLSFEPTLGVFNDAALDSADFAIAEAERLGLRLICPLTDNWKYFHGGKHDFTGWCNQSDETLFYTSACPMAAFQDYVTHRLLHTNPYTGRRAVDEPAIAMWETGNELEEAPASWTRWVADLIRSLDPNHLILDGREGVAPDHVGIGNISAFCDHFYYTKNGMTGAQRITAGATAASTAGKVYLAGEYGWTLGETNSTLAACLGLNGEDGGGVVCSGTAAWSLFPHADGFGFVPHNDGFTLHYPGGPTPDSQGSVFLTYTLREHGAAMAGGGGGGSVPPLLPPTSPPIITSALPTNSSIAWQGCTMCVTYTVEVGGTSGGPWSTLSSPTTPPTDFDTPWGVQKGLLSSGQWVRAQGVGLDGALSPWSAPFQAK